MQLINTEFKNRVRETLLFQRANFTGSDSMFAKQYDIAGTVFNRMKKGQLEGILQDSRWLNVGRKLGLYLNEKPWNIVKTPVLMTIEEDVAFCQKNSLSMIFVDDCGIGKTVAAEYLSRTLSNCFYVDASQAKTATSFARLIAKTLGIDPRGRLDEIKEDVKYALKALPNPVFIIDEFGDLKYEAFLDVKELMNSTMEACGWYLIGAEGARKRIRKGIEKEGVGYREIFDRFGQRYTTVVPTEKHEKLAFYRALITQVVTANIKDKSQVAGIVKRCLIEDENGKIGGLRRAKYLLLLTEGEQS